MEVKPKTFIPGFILMAANSDLHAIRICTGLDCGCLHALPVLNSSARSHTCDCPLLAHHLCFPFRGPYTHAENWERVFEYCCRPHTKGKYHNLHCQSFLSCVVGGYKNYYAYHIRGSLSFSDGLRITSYVGTSLSLRSPPASLYPSFQCHC
jgi:hypothetical protein